MPQLRQRLLTVTLKYATVTNGKELTFVKGAFGVHWEDHAGWSMGERMGMGPDTSRARSVRVTENKEQRQSGNHDDRSEGRGPITTSVFQLRIDTLGRRAR